MRKKTFGILVFFILCTGFIFSCTHKQAVSQGEYPSAEQSDPALVRGVLDNGFRYLLMKNTTPKDRVSVHLNVFTGSVAETENQRGMAHFLEHMLFNGSEHFKPGELINYFQSIGMDFGADANARTSFFSTTYDLSLPKGNEEYLDEAFLVIQDYAGGALLLESEIDRERGVVLAEKRERDSVSYRTFEKELAFELPGSVLPRRLPIGTEKVINAIDRRAMKAFYDRWYRPDNMALVVVGDMDIDLAESMIKKRFSLLAPRMDAPVNEADVAWTPHKGTRFFYHSEPEAGATQIAIERLKYKAVKPQSIAQFKAEAVEYIGDRIFQNRLSRMISEQSADFTNAAIYTGTYLRHMDMAAVQASCDPEKWEAVLAQLETALRQALTFGFSLQELSRVKADTLSALESKVEKAGTRKSATIARTILSSLNRRELFLSPAQERDLLVSHIKALSLEAVNSAFRSAWEDDHRLVLVSGNLDAGNAPEEKISSVYHASLAVPSTPYTDLDIKRFPYLTPPEKKADVVSDKENIKDLGIRQIELSNHVRINLKQTDFKEGEFSFKAVFGSGKTNMPKIFNGLSGLVEFAVEDGGFGAMDYDQLQAALAGKNVKIEFNIKENFFSIQGNAAPKDAETVMQLLYTYFMDPGFRSKSLTLSKVKYRQQIDAMERTPEGILKIKGNKFLAGGDPRFGMGTAEQAAEITMDQIITWMKPAFRSGPLEVSFVGDFDVKVLKALAENYLGALDIRSLAATVRPGNSPGTHGTGEEKILFPKGKSKTFYLDTRLEKAQVRVAFLTDDFWDIMTTRKFSLLSQILSERLRKTIRESLGASYSPYVFNKSSLRYQDYGVMQTVVNLSPDRVDDITLEIMALIKELIDKGITSEELSLVKEPLINHLKVYRQTNSYWLNSVLADSFRHPMRLDWAVNLLTGYQSIDAQSLTRLAKQYLVPEERAVIKILPKKD